MDTGFGPYPAASMPPGLVLPPGVHARQHSSPGKRVPNSPPVIIPATSRFSARCHITSWAASHAQLGIRVRPPPARRLRSPRDPSREVTRNSIKTPSLFATDRGSFKVTHGRSRGPSLASVSSLVRRLRETRLERVRPARYKFPNCERIGIAERSQPPVCSPACQP